MYTILHTAHVHDVDLNNRMSPGSVMRLLHICADTQMRADSPSLEAVRDIGIAMIMNRLTMHFLKPIDRGDELEVSTWPCEAAGFVLPRNYEIRRGGELITQAESTWALVDLATRKLLRCDSIDLSRYVYGERQEFRYDAVPRGAELEDAGTFPVLYEFCDLNRHMNNTRYLDMLCDFVPGIEDRTLKRLTIHYRNEAPFGSTIRVQRGCTDDTFFFRTSIDGKANVDAVLVF